MNFEIKYTKGDLIIAENLDNQNEYLSGEKSKIDQHKQKWDRTKKLINNYEYIYYNYNKNNNISDIIPISRSFFKLKEILIEFKIKNTENSVAFCIAEAPGGFIQSLQDYNLKKIYGTTLLSNTDKDIPRWNHKISKYKNVELLYGSKKNGDIYDMNNILSIIKYIKKGNLDLITGDGGFDYSKDYNKQEINSLSLIYSEILLALNLQKKGGYFICKIFDIFNNKTIQLLYFLSLQYNKFYIYKPHTSRLTNSEKYIVCMDYKGYNKNKINQLIHGFKDKDLNIKIDSNFMKQIYFYNEKYIEKQVANINYGICVIKDHKKISPTKDQITCAINWCKKYNIPINQQCTHLNKTFIT
jgi:23S rRNA U2552 (ribose-2'-O)-methylase RlmE/FtsJ